LCNFFSAVILPSVVRWLPRSSSHEDIIDAHQIPMDGARGPRGVRAELLPPIDPATVDDLSTWEYRLDQDVVPEWYVADDCAARIRGAAELARQIDPVAWSVLTAATRARAWTGAQRTAVLGSAHVRFSLANLRGANLCGANLCGADLREANLCGADLCGANLCGAEIKITQKEDFLKALKIVIEE
jgi:hypothetical protein